MSSTRQYLTQIKLIALIETRRLEYNKCKILPVYAINSPQIYDDMLDKCCYGVTIPNLALEKMADCNISFPPFAEQKRIVTAIEVAFAKLDKISENLLN